jgi:aspartyl-tRNA(Asn)/glutamyl-tRNA(Gln) amidotransferase subunit B
MGFEPVIGFEVHAQLDTRSKIFCGCENAGGGEPNTRTCPVCLGLPGALPVLNEAVVDMGVAAALALDADVSGVSGFARKNYFYPDLPKGYQITQFGAPVARNGHLDVETGHGTVRVGIRQVHVEEDAGKTVHDAATGASLVDMNRCGVPLLEVVTEPDLRSVDDADRFLTALRELLVRLGVTKGRMHEGELRFDANISVRRVGDDKLGVQTEIKNLNSFRSARRALAFELERQSRLLASGRGVVHETLLWDEASGRAVPMRSKEVASDYRYFPEPDLVDFTVGRERLERLRAEQPELPRDTVGRFVRDYGLPPYDAGVLTASRDTMLFYEMAVRAVLRELEPGALPPGSAREAGSEEPSGAVVLDPLPEDLDALPVVAKAVSNWVMVVLTGYLNEHGLSVDELAGRAGAMESGRPGSGAALATRFAAVVAARLRGELSEPAARRLFEAAVEGPEPIGELIERMGLRASRDGKRLEALVRSILEAHPSEVERYRSGATKLLRFFVGRALSETGGSADPEVLTELFRRELEEGGEA